MAFAFTDNNEITKYPVGSVEIRRRFPETSFPKPLDGVDLSSFGVVTVGGTNQPSFNAATQKLEEGTPTLVDGAWKQVWNVVNLSDSELAEITAGKAADIRATRNKKLADSDWTQLADSPASTNSWGTYRQALRDIPGQSGFPDSVTWPTEPS